MYKYVLNIFIISDSNYIQSVLEGVGCNEGFEHSFTTFDGIPSAVGEGSIIICDGKEELMPEINKRKGKTAVTVLCAESPTSYTDFDELWKKPYNKEEIQFYFKRLIDRIKLEKDYALSCNYLDSLIDNSPDLVWFKDLRGAHLKVNDSFCRAVNKTKQQIEGRGHYYIWDIQPDEYSKGEYVCLESEEMVINAQKTMTFDEMVKTKAGMRQFVTVKTPIFDEFNHIMGTVGLARDVTDINNISRELSLFIDNMPFGIIISDEQDIIRNINRKMEELTGYELKSFIGTETDKSYSNIKELIENTPDKKVFILELSLKNGTKIVEVAKIHITDVFKNHIGFMRIFRDITTERTLEEQVIQSANTDFLTGLYNRRYFYDYISKNCMGKPLSIMSVDLDNFKSINDTYGHQMGDEVLIITAKKLKDGFDSELVVRNGGDEFIVVFASADSVCVEEKTKKVLTALNNAFADDKRFANVSASAGIAITPSLDESIDELLKKSDMALYSVKRGNKGGYCIMH